MLKKTFHFFILFVVILTCGIVLTKPKGLEKYSINRAENSLIEELNSNSISYFNDCHIDNDNVTLIDGADPYIVFDGVAGNSKSIVFNIKEPSSTVFLKFYYDDSSGYTEENSAEGKIDAGQTFCVLPVNTQNIVSVRVDSEQEYSFSSIEFFALPPVTETVYLGGTGILYYCICVFSATVLTVLVLLLNKKYNLTKRIKEFFINNSKTVLKVALAILISLSASAVAELIIAQFTGTANTVFNVYRFIFISGVLLCVSAIIVFSKQMAEKPENAFLFIALTLCAVFVIIAPFGHISWDTESHYGWAVNASHFGIRSFVSEADYKAVTNSPDFMFSKEYEDNAIRIQAMDKSYLKTSEVYLGRQTTIAHLPYGLFLSIGRLVLGNSFYRVFTFGKFASVLVYCFVCFFAIKKLKSGKMIASVVALFPISLFLASNYSYDYFVNCFVMLGMAYFVGVQQDTEKQITAKETVIMCSSFALACIPKLIYAPFMIIPFFIRRKKIKNKKLYYTICTVTIVLLFAMLAVRSSVSLGGSGDTRGGDTNPAGQVNFILSKPLEYAKILFGFLKGYLSIGGMKNYLTNFAYIGIGSGYSIFIALIIITTLTDKNEYDIKAYNIFSKILVVLLYLGLSVLVATALYIAFNPVGNQVINGCQPRYLIPLVYPLISIIGIGFRNPVNRKFYNTAVLLLCAGVNLYNIGEIMLPYWL